VCLTELLDLAPFRGTLCLVEDKCLRKRVKSGSSATLITGEGQAKGLTKTWAPSVGLPRWHAIATRESARGPCTLVAGGGRPVLPCWRRAAWRPWPVPSPGGRLPRLVGWCLVRGGDIKEEEEEESRVCERRCRGSGGVTEEVAVV
jgi:hypothetical protein